MWTRVELKERAKEALHRNYWKIVLVASLLFLLGCGSGGYQLIKSTHNAGTETDEEKSGMRVEVVTDEDSVGEADTGQGQEADEMRSLILMKVNEDTGEVRIEDIDDETGTENYAITFTEAVVAGGMAIALFVILAVFASAVVLVADIFLLNPLSVGGCRFMTKSVEDVAQMKELAYGFDHSYKNIVKVLFYSELHIFLWALVFVIPGIVKRYQYYMAPYILAEHPDMDYREVLRMSRNMMEGNKWKTFVLGLSFILWDFFGALTLGVGELLYVQPYRQLTFAALYCELKKGTEDGYGL